MLKITTGFMHVCVNYYSQVKHNNFFTNTLHLTPQLSSIFCTYKMQLVTRLTSTPLGLAENYIS